MVTTCFFFSFHNPTPTVSFERATDNELGQVNVTSYFAVFDLLQSGWRVTTCSTKWLPVPWWLWWRRRIGRPERCVANIARSIPRRKKRSRWGRGRVGRRIRPWAFARCRGSYWAHRNRIRSSFSPKMPWNTQFSNKILVGGRLRAAKRLVSRSGAHGRPLTG